MRNAQSPFGRFHSLTEEEKTVHIQRHPMVAESYNELFELLTGYRVHLIPDKVWGPVLFYTARYRWMKHSFAVDRSYCIAAQLAVMERGLKTLQQKFEDAQVEDEFLKITKKYSSTEAKRARP